MAMIEIYNSDEQKGCLICGEDMVTLTSPIEIHCAICGKLYETTSHCTQMHYICDTCLGSSPAEAIKELCLSSSEIDPIALAVECMNLPAIRIYGSEHHFIVPATLLTCTMNKLGRHSELKQMLEIAEERTDSTVPKTCGYGEGTCGAAMGTGIFLNVFTGQNPETEDEWSLANSIIAASLMHIAHNIGHKCCKRDTYLSIEAAVDFIKDKFAIQLPVSEALCTFSLRNQQCKREECTYYNIGFSLV